MTTALTQGANAPLSAVRVSVEVTAPQRLDVSGLLLTAAGKVRSDADLVFFNAPRGPGVTHRPASGSAPDAITVDTWAVPADVAKIVVAASLDDPAATFAGTEPTATIRDADTGRVLTTFTPPRLTRETALVVVEIYRRGAEWKVRAVGQGYANGLAGIATDFGVSVDEPGPAEIPPMPDYAPPAPAGSPTAQAPQAPLAPPAAPPRPATPPNVPRTSPPPLPRPGSTWTRAGSTWSRAARSRWSRTGARCSVRSGWGSAGSRPATAATSTWTPPASSSTPSASGWRPSGS